MANPPDPQQIPPQSQQQSQPGEGFTDQQQEALVQLGKMMGPHATGFDERVQALHDKRHAKEHAETDYEKEFGGDRPHEASYQKMQAAQRGGAEIGLGPTQAEQALAKQSQALQQAQASAGQAQASQAQAQQVPVNAPPAPTGPQGVTQPFPAQAKAQGPPGGDIEPPQAPGDEQPSETRD